MSISPISTAIFTDDYINLRGFRASVNPRFEGGIVDFMDGIPDFMDTFNTFYYGR